MCDTNYYGLCMFLNEMDGKKCRHKRYKFKMVFLLYVRVYSYHRFLIQQIQLCFTFVIIKEFLRYKYTFINLKHNNLENFENSSFFKHYY